MNLSKRLKSLGQLLSDFIKKCSDDHVAPFGAMAAFFMILSIFPFMIFLLTLTRYMPFTKYDVIHVANEILAFENSSFVNGLIHEIYGKAGSTVSILSITVALWSSSRGVYAIIVGLNSVFDIDENRNYLVLRLVSMVYTFFFGILMAAVLIIWVFGNIILDYVKVTWPFLQEALGRFIEVRTVFSLVILTFVFMLIYTFVPNRKCSFIKQFPGAFLSTAGWLFVSFLCSLYVRKFSSSFNYLYGSMAGIIMLLLWSYWSMTILFFGAEVNYFLENSKNYHKLVSIIRPRYKRKRRAKERALSRGMKDVPDDGDDIEWEDPEFETEEPEENDVYAEEKADQGDHGPGVPGDAD